MTSLVVPLYVLRDAILDRQKSFLSPNCMMISGLCCILTVSSGPRTGGVASEVSCMKKTSSHWVNSRRLQSRGC